MAKDPTIELPVMPWTTPNDVGLRGTLHAIAVPLSDVKAEVLARLCEEFRAEIFKKAGKVDPWPRA